jgi:ring-1,2-phenylacetyl-CoA epoxidase subunit PaaD
MANERARELRRNRTAAERLLWWKLCELKQAGFKFRQQVPIDPYIVDFACFSKRLVVEVDGGTHSTDEEIARDRRRERHLRDRGFRVLRVWNAEVRENIDGVMDTIVDALGPPSPTPARKGKGRTSRRRRVHPRERAPASRDPRLDLAHRAAAAVVDPEIPVLTLEDLGVLRGVERRDGRIVVKITPTYSGCPATLAIRQAVETALAEAGIAGASVETVLAPPWSSDDITEEGRRKLQEYGIAPPTRAAGARPLSSAPGNESRPLVERGQTPFPVESVACPRCGSTATAKVSEFGSTACKALWRCETCAEPFEAFKCL